MALGSDTLQPGATLGKYVILGVLGEGGAARVYEARHTVLGTRHAVKILTSGSRGLQERLLLEGRVQASLQHPNIVRVVDVDTIEGRPCLVMEFVDGPTLAECIAQQAPSLRTIDEMAKQLIDAMAYAHEKGLVHRDLKPENVLLAPRGKQLVPKISDFGLVKVVDGERSRTRTGSTMGTPLYMSPEQVRCAKHVDHRSDIFSMGTLLYTLLAGTNPFDAADMYEVFQAIVEGRYTPLRELHPELPERMLSTVERAMHLDVDERFQTSTEMLANWSATDAEPLAFDEAFLDTARKIVENRSLTTTNDDSPTTYPEADLVTLGPMAQEEPEAPSPTLQPAQTEEALVREEKSSGAAWALGAAVLLLAGAGVLGFLVTMGSTPAPVDRPSPERMVQPVAPPPAPAVVAPEPVAAPEPPAEEPVVPASPTEPAPVEAAAPVIVAPVVQEPTPPEPVVEEPVVEEPVADTPPVEPASAEDVAPEPEQRKTTFTNGRAAVRVILRGASGDHPPGELPPGTYTIYAFFDDTPTQAGTVTVPEGGEVVVACNPMLRLCETEIR